MRGGDLHHRLRGGGPDELPVGDEETRSLGILDEEGDDGPVRRDAEEVAVRRTGGTAKEAIADASPPAEGVDEDLPVAAAQLERHEFFCRKSTKLSGPLPGRGETPERDRSSG
jgi:hypothetical protein